MLIKAPNLLKYFAFGLLSIGLQVCSANELPYGLLSGKPYAGTELKVLTVATPQFKGIALRDAEFTRLTGVKVSWEEVPFAKLQSRVAEIGDSKNTGFDVINYLDSWGPANANWFEPLYSWMERDGISMDRYPPAFRKSATFEGQVKGLPLRAHAQLMFYRKDIFNKLGIKPPTSWSDVVEASKAIKSAGLGIEPLGLYYGKDGNRQNLFVWLNFLWGSGARLFEANNDPGWLSNQALEATRKYIGLHTNEQLTAVDSVSWTESQAREAFAQGKVAMTPMWWWAYSVFTNAEKSTLKPEQIGFVAMPTYGKNQFARTYAISMPFSISKYSSNKGAAWEFMKWLSNPALEKRNAIDRQVNGVKIINNVVTQNANLLDEDINRVNDDIGYAAYKSLRASNIMPQTSEWPLVGDLLSAALADAAKGGDVEQLMNDAADKARNIIRRSGY